MPSFVKASADVSFNCFQTVSLDEVVAAMKAFPDKSCTLDPLPTKLLKAAVDVISPFLTELFNRSPSFGNVPDAFKIAHISPHLKKADLDSSDVRSYRPISNLSIISKLLERLIARQLKAHLDSYGLFPRLQSAYRANHSTETAVLKVLSDFMLAIDDWNLSALALLDLSAALTR